MLSLKTPECTQQADWSRAGATKVAIRRVWQGVRDAEARVYMLYLELTLPTAEENLALDEALLEEVCAGEQEHDVLRIWESPAPAVIVGRASRLSLEVNLPHCAANRIPVLRRCSGGASVVLGAGCL
ncbi:MAG: hypothetical protein KDA92_22015, partial [Planctomycetales bacterium]|nr:hypothetical protein [Planctomycetales bacterium]